MKNIQITITILKITAAVIMLQTLYYKFTGQPESIFIFSSLGLEPYGRILAGVSELIASALLLIPRTTLLGAVMGIGIMLGAIMAHVFVLGVNVMHDGGKLFTLALVTLICCSSIVIIYRHKIPQLLKLKF